jgi:hypothetical protein
MCTMAAPACAAAMAGDRAMRALRYLGIVAGDGAGNDDVMVHVGSPASIDSEAASLYYIDDNI